ncbi:putative AbiEi antitoxin of type IV toxin-antitoxin system [Kribbella amoyensis]|uniref:Putative AbiEi antitoxin of type IV toxin-antitoxin system n=1 Tax=Kribbella amoyensis TaxID=996641 RepID=A0A561BLJ6_9ACTN|nr:putative AbiEi antitoxin of type IV toxin-antitoxin system [Kribbella amoyensis]
MLSLADEQWGLVTSQQVEATGIAKSTLARQVRNGVFERAGTGVYRLKGSGAVEHLELRAAWIQLDPATPAWERSAAQGVVSHRSAAELFGLGQLPADIHEFTLPQRKQLRRSDVRLHRARLDDADWTRRGGLPVTRPRRIAADLLAEREDPGAVGQIIADALRAGLESSADVAAAVAPYALSHGFRSGDGLGLLRWLLELSGDPDQATWIAQAARPVGRGDA